MEFLSSIGVFIFAVLLWNAIVNANRWRGRPGERGTSTLDRLNYREHLWYEHMAAAERHRVAGETEEEKLALFRACEVGERLGEDHELHVAALRHLGVYWIRVGRAPVGRGLLNQALENSREYFGENHPVTCFSVAEMAWGHELLKESDTADSLMADALKRAESLEPAEPWLVAAIHKQSGEIAEHRGDRERAERLYEQAAEMMIENGEPGSPPFEDAVHALGRMYFGAERFQAFESLLRRVRECAEERLPEGHPYIHVSMVNHSIGLNYVGRNAEAEAVVRRALELQGGLEGRPPGERLELLNGLAQLLIAQGKTGEAEGVLTSAIEEGAAAGASETPAMEHLLGTMAIIHGRDGRTM